MFGIYVEVVIDAVVVPAHVQQKKKRVWDAKTMHKADRLANILESCAEMCEANIMRSLFSRQFFFFGCALLLLITSYEINVIF